MHHDFNVDVVVTVPKTVVLLQPRPEVAINVVVNVVGSASTNELPSTEDNVATDINHSLLLRQQKKVIDAMGRRRPGLHGIEIPVSVGSGICKVLVRQF